MPTWLITGGSGFLGGHLPAALPSGVDAVMLGRRRPIGWSGRFERVDLGDRAHLRASLEAVAPRVVMHLAGRTPPAESRTYFQSNTRNTWHLVDALATIGRPCRVVMAGSAAEDHAGARHGHYGLSKWAATTVGLSMTGPLEFISARVQNPIGPGMPASSAFGRFAEALARPGREPLVMPVGDLDARRDFVDVRDVCDALVALATNGRSGRIYPVGRGVSVRVGEGLDALIRRSGRRVVVEGGTSMATHLRPAPRADLGPITADTGWSPRVDWSRSIDDLWAWASGASAGRRSA